MAAIATPFSSEDPNAPAIFKSKEFINDRSSLTNRQLDLDELKSRRPLIIDKLKSNYEWIELQLSDDRQWFLDTITPSIGDIHVATNIWFMNSASSNKEFENLSELYPKTYQWFNRFIKFIEENKQQQQQKPLNISGEEALEIAKKFKPSSYDDDGNNNNNDNNKKKLGNKKIGDKVIVLPDDYGKIP